ncbi:AraC family transcriptional regulator [Cohnella zeiphila]|uniref:Helix-turn-helix transcriptional regulator n=1 Tax=Cohnella zeiphila TaxID=2761120 RepID=A0A7X0SHQ9_9BACL|nr:AraC family transcriptional regulator [Cohnella zeiphila]MBB6730198.1 helix-turn-helix transcriptional regulator [Cohnella zeiphila]
MEAEEMSWPVIHTVGDVLVQRGFVLGPREIGDFELVYFPEGTGTVYELGDDALPLDEPCFVLTRPGECHRYRFDPAANVRHLFVHFDYAAFRDPSSGLEALVRTDRIPALRSSLAAGMIRQILRIANEQGPGWKRRISALLAAALEELQACAGRGSGPASQPVSLPISLAIEYMEEHLAEPALSIEKIARHSGWSHEHFTRVFAAELGMTPKRALLERRLLRAERMMLRAEGTVKQIAFSVGFGDEHHFSKMYKRIRGITASEYMERCKDPLFRHTAAAVDPDTPYPINCYVMVNAPIK